AAAGARPRAHHLGHGLDLVGLAAVADRRVQGADHPSGDAGGVRLPAAGRARQAPDPRPQRRPPLPRQSARDALRDRGRPTELVAPRSRWARADAHAPRLWTAHPARFPAYAQPRTNGLIGSPKGRATRQNLWRRASRPPGGASRRRLEARSARRAGETPASTVRVRTDPSAAGIDPPTGMAAARLRGRWRADRSMRVGPTPAV